RCFLPVERNDMEAAQNIPIATAAPRKSAATTARKQATPRERLKIGIFGGVLVLASLLIWIAPHALDSLGIFSFPWSRPLTIAYLPFGGSALYVAVANIPFKKERPNPFAARN